jgi:hypothetical protein
MTDWEAFRDAVLAAFQRHGTAFLRTETLLKEIRFGRDVSPREDQGKLDALLERMREEGLVVLNQPKFAALSLRGRAAAEAMTPDRLAEVGKWMEDRIREDP